jgi:hypothetical protein
MAGTIAQKTKGKAEERPTNGHEYGTTQENIGSP